MIQENVNYSEYIIIISSIIHIINLNSSKVFNKIQQKQTF